MKGIGQTCGHQALHGVVTASALQQDGAEGEASFPGGSLQPLNCPFSERGEGNIADDPAAGPACNGQSREATRHQVCLLIPASRWCRSVTGAHRPLVPGSQGKTRNPKIRSCWTTPRVPASTIVAAAASLIHTPHPAAPPPTSVRIEPSAKRFREQTLKTLCTVEATTAELTVYHKENELFHALLSRFAA